MPDSGVHAVTWVDGVIARETEEVLADTSNQVIVVAGRQVCPSDSLPKEGIP